jgi:hypothetical protein
MAEDRKSLKERLASIRETKQSTHKEAKIRVASAWTLAKSLLPTAPNEIQYKLASSLLANSTKALTAMLRQTAINAHYTKIAEKFEQVHKVELNEFLEDESFLKKMKGEVEKELKGEPKTADLNKKADETEEPKKDEAPKDEAPKDEMPPMGDVPPEGDVPPVDETVPPVDETTPPMDETMPPEGGAPAGEPIPDEKKQELQEKIDNLEADVTSLEEAIEGEEELDFTKIFNEDDMGDKTDALANEGEGEEFGEDGLPVEADGGAGFFGSEPNELEEGGATASPEDFFHHASRYDISSLDVLLADQKVAAKVQGVDDPIVERGDMADDLLNEGGVPDAEEDHEDVILYEVLKTLGVDKYDPGAKREGEPKLEPPKKSVASKAPAKPAAKAASIRSLGNVKTATDMSKEQAMLANLVFTDDI